MESLECLVKFWKRFETVRVTADALVCRHPCFVSSIHVESGNVANPSKVHFYDGHDTSGEEKLGFNTRDGGYEVEVDIPHYFKKGLYIDFEANTTSVTVQFMIEPD